jgi:hypothetical protein
MKACPAVTFLYEPFCGLTTGWTKMHLNFVLLSTVQPYLTAKNRIVLRQWYTVLSECNVFTMAQPLVGQGLLMAEDLRSHSETLHIDRIPLDEWPARSRDLYPLPDNTKRSQQTVIHARGGIRATADPRLRLRGPHIGRL